jgi:hypothetical protein
MPLTSALVLGGSSLLGSLFGARSAKKASKAASAAQERATQQMIQQADRASQLQYGLGREQLDFARRQYEESIPIRDQVVGLQTRAMEQQMEQGQDYYNYMRDTFRPGETRMAAQAAQYDTEANRERLASEAVQRAALAFQGGQGMATREMARRGLDPSSGAFAAMTNQNAIQSAAMQATGANQARTMAEQTGWARNLDVAGLGRGLPGASSAAYGGASSAGSAALGNQMAPGAQYNQGYQLGAGTIGSGFGQGLNAYGSIMQNATGLATNAMSNYYGAIGSGIGMTGTLGAAAYGAYNVPSTNRAPIGANADWSTGVPTNR